ncbi:MAG: glycoside hydrolase, partial [Armatimonadetes bacterium]|nr:glycoside hydrolase [Armatimonadota bacterium]
MERTAFMNVVAALVFLHAIALTVRPAQCSDWSIENAVLKVTVSEDSGRVTVLDKKSNHLWKQAPTIPNRKIKVIKANTKSVSFTVTMKDDSSKEIPLTVTLKLQDNASALQVGISADPKLEMSSFDFIEPFVCDSEYAFLAIADWCNGHIYPCNLDEWPGYNLDEFLVNLMLLPWVAVVDLKSGLGYSVTVETADDAAIRCVKFGKTRAPMVKWIPQWGRFGYERKIIYTFTPSGGYVALAKEFRKYARKQGWLVTLKEKAKSNPNINRLFGAALLWDYYKHIDGIEAYNIGVEKAIHHVSRWDCFYNYPRVFEHDYYRRLEDDIVKEENALGWLTEEYIQLADAFPISDNNLQPNENYDRPQTFLTDINNNVVLGWRDERGQMSMRCSAFFLRRAKQAVGARLSYHPINSIYFDVSTQRQLMECYSKFHPRTRTEYKADVIEVLKYLKSLRLVVHGECAKWWTVPYQDIGIGTASILTNLPWHGIHPAKYGQTEYSDRKFPDNVWQKYETWGTLGHRYRVPLWELVFHDCIVSTQRESDTMDWTSGTADLPFSYVDKKIALCVLFGTMPTYYHCIVPESAGAWTRNRLEFIRSYRNACKPFEILADKEMLSHESVSYTHL